MFAIQAAPGRVGITFRVSVTLLVIEAASDRVRFRVRVRVSMTLLVIEAASDRVRVRVRLSITLFVIEVTLTITLTDAV